MRSPMYTSLTPRWLHLVLSELDQFAEKFTQFASREEKLKMLHQIILIAWQECPVCTEIFQCFTISWQVFFPGENYRKQWWKIVFHVKTFSPSRSPGHCKKWDVVLEELMRAEKWQAKHFPGEIIITYPCWGNRYINDLIISGYFPVDQILLVTLSWAPCSMSSWKYTWLLCDKKTIHFYAIL